MPLGMQGDSFKRHSSFSNCFLFYSLNILQLWVEVLLFLLFQNFYLLSSKMNLRFSSLLSLAYQSVALEPTWLKWHIFLF